ncbi:MAG: Anaerobic glycerol-3-phosphate dehydrogenase subunit C [Alphaproteobacteria bacterium MarineAlpha9_Bin7]|nr:MAG: Anaerobic glycerol-3-phosphate dehydrogenase subunit C [Alphaproteobacteria bacterium MarineAlpha9_Bin7]
MEGGLRAPTRHPHDFDEPDYLDEEKLDSELRRVFDICHGCRRCFNLCDSFPRLFDLIDESDSGELDTVPSAGFGLVMDSCTLCDMCFMVSCPYVPPHEFDIDFPHLVLRYRAAQSARGTVSWVDRQLARTDRNGKLAGSFAFLANWCSKTTNRFTRSALEFFAGIHRAASLPKYHHQTLVRQAASRTLEINIAAPSFGRKVALFATCFSNYNDPGIGLAARSVLARNGVDCAIVYPECCGMPQLEQADFLSISKKAKIISAFLVAWINKGYDIVALVPSCALMLKFEWPLILPNDENVRKLSKHTSDISEYVIRISQDGGLAEGLNTLPGGVTVHLACHARAQNIGPKAVEMLRLIPDVELNVIERCSGHGGAWGVKKGNFETGLKVGEPAARQAVKAASAFVASECPLAGEHLRQGMERLADGPLIIQHVSHPIQLMAHAYGLETD